MASSPLCRAEPELSRLSPPRTLNRAGVSNTAGLVSTALKAWTPGRRVSSAGVPIGVLLYLASVVLVSAATVGLFFGSGFFCSVIQVRKCMRTPVPASAAPRSTPGTPASRL
jgi:hypothetical protein